jgi:tetratricopeptide (TPR) repeat protein
MKEEFDDFDNHSISKFESMLKTNSFLFFDSNEYEEIIIYYIETGNIFLAKKAISLALKQYQDSTILSLLHVEVLLMNNEIKKAEKIAFKIYEIDPLNPDVLIQKAKICSKQKDHLKAIKLLKEIKKGSETYYDALLLIGKEYLFIDDFQNAKKIFIECLNNDFDYSILNNILYCFDSIGDSESTINYLNDFLEANPYCEIAWHQLGKQYVKDKMYDEALSAFDFAIISDDSFVGAYLEMAKILEKLNRINEAIEKYEISIGINQPTSFALFRIGRCHYKLGNDDLALTYFIQTIEEDPIHDKAWMSIAVHYFNKKDFNESKINLIKALEINSDKLKYWELYIKINIKLELFEDVELGVKEILSLGQLDINTLTFLTKTLIKIPNNNDLFKGLLKSINLFPKSAENEINYLLSAIYFKLQEKENAVSHLKKAYFFNPSKYDYFKELFPIIPKLQVFKNMHTI